MYNAVVTPLRHNALAILTATAVVACGARSSLEPGQEAVPAGGFGGIGGQGGIGGVGGFGGDGGQGGEPFDDCVDEDVTFIYLVTSALGMYAFKPQSQELEYRGQLDCPTMASPFSMAVRRNGLAYIVMSDGTLWEASVKDASCSSTPFVAGQQQVNTFGMGFAVNDDGITETLFISDIDYGIQASKGLASIDLDSFDVSPLQPFSNSPGFRIELTAEMQDLYAFIIDSQVGGGHLARVDKTTGAMFDLQQVPLGADIGSWHFAWWGGEFYFFTAPSGGTSTAIRKYNSDTKTLQTIANVGQPVVGAGVSTCAPP